LQKKLKDYTNNSQQYKYIFVKKKISNKNKDKRVVYSKEYKDKSVEDFWSYIFFTNKVYIDPILQAVRNILQEYRKRYNNKNIQERRKKLGIYFYIAI
jgi:hypothetical protein